MRKHEISVSRTQKWIRIWNMKGTGTRSHHPFPVQLCVLLLTYVLVLFVFFIWKEQKHRAWKVNKWVPKEMQEFPSSSISLGHASPPVGVTHTPNANTQTDRRTNDLATSCSSTGFTWSAPARLHACHWLFWFVTQAIKAQWSLHTDAAFPGPPLPPFICRPSRSPPTHARVLFARFIKVDSGGMRENFTLGEEINLQMMVRVCVPERVWVWVFLCVEGQNLQT